MLAGLPQTPTHANPVTKFERAARRQRVVLRAWSAFIHHAAEADVARAEKLQHPQRGKTRICIPSLWPNGAPAGLRAARRGGLHARPAGPHDAGRQEQAAAYTARAAACFDFARRKPTAGRGLLTCPMKRGAGAAIRQRWLSIRPRRAAAGRRNGHRARRLTAVLQPGESVQLTAGAALSTKTACAAQSALALDPVRMPRARQHLAARAVPRAEAPSCGLSPHGPRARVVGGFDHARNIQPRHAAWGNRARAQAVCDLGALEAGVTPARW